MSDLNTTVNFGWLPDLPSIQDYTTEHTDIKPLLATVHKASKKASKAIPISRYNKTKIVVGRGGIGKEQHHQKRRGGK